MPNSIVSTLVKKQPLRTSPDVDRNKPENGKRY